MFAALALLVAAQTGLPRIDDFVEDAMTPPPLAMAMAEAHVDNASDREVEVSWSDGNARHVLHVAPDGRGDFRVLRGMPTVTVSVPGVAPRRLSTMVGEAPTVLLVSADGRSTWGAVPSW